jgi:hypothetical protein
MPLRMKVKAATAAGGLGLGVLLAGCSGQGATIVADPGLHAIHHFTPVGIHGRPSGSGNVCIKLRRQLFPHANSPFSSQKQTAGDQPADQVLWSSLPANTKVTSCALSAASPDDLVGLRVIHLGPKNAGLYRYVGWAIVARDGRWTPDEKVSADMYNNDD